MQKTLSQTGLITSFHRNSLSNHAFCLNMLRNGSQSFWKLHRSRVDWKTYSSDV